MWPNQEKNMFAAHITNSAMFCTYVLLKIILCHKYCQNWTGYVLNRWSLVELVVG
jgi:hypothetical protein